MQYLCVYFFKACLSSYLDCELHDIWGDLCSTLYTHIIAYSRHLSNNTQQIDEYICFWKKKVRIHNKQCVLPLGQQVLW